MFRRETPQAVCAFIKVGGRTGTRCRDFRRVLGKHEPCCSWHWEKILSHSAPLTYLQRHLSYENCCENVVGHSKKDSLLENKQNKTNKHKTTTAKQRKALNASWLFLVTLWGLSDDLDIFYFPARGLKAGGMRGAPGKGWCQTAFSLHTLALPCATARTDPTELSKSTVGGICNASYESGFKVLTAPVCQCCSVSWSIALPWEDSFPKGFWALTWNGA